jgi:hypothetical protein
MAPSLTGAATNAALKTQRLATHGHPALAGPLDAALATESAPKRR